MLHVSNISKSYGIETVLTDVSFVINRGERVALVGPNGSGKTTLLRLITGLEPADRGSIRFDVSETAVGYLAQALIFDEEASVAEVLAGLVAEHSRAWAKMQQVAEQMAGVTNNDQLAELTETYAQAETRFEAAGGYALEARLDAILTGLGLADVPRDLPVEKLSGGQKTRLGLAGLLIQQPALLLLDEPTNHLDLQALTWLEAWLRDYDGAVLVVSHDRAFLDTITTRTLAIDPVAHTVRDFAGNHSALAETLAQEIDRQWQAYRDQQDEIVRLKQSAQHLRGLAKFRRGGKADTNDKFARGFFSNRSAGTVNRAKQIEQRLEQLLTEDKIDKPDRQWHLRVNFGDDGSGARQVLNLENVTMAFERQTLFQKVTLSLMHGQRIALIGPNGTGKTTLLRLIAGELAPTNGQVRLGAGVKPGYFAQEQEILDPDSTPYDLIEAAVEEMNQSEIRRFLHHFLFAGNEVFVKIGSLSFGERTRLMLALLVAQGCNLLLLDEPLNHLDIESRECFEQALSQFPGTVLAVAHDRAFIRRFATRVWEIGQSQISERHRFK